MRSINRQTRRTHPAPAMVATLTLAVPVFATLAGCGGGGGSIPLPTRTVVGGTQTVSGSTVSSWEVVSQTGEVLKVGVTVPANVFQNPPSSGSGPAGSFIDLPFPSETTGTTFLNHFEMHWEANGHPPALYQVPHFDLHFYGIPESTVASITPPDTAAPDTNHLPSGYVYPGVNAAVPQMGTHAIPQADLAPGATFTATMILGYWGGTESFVEPMVTQSKLLARQSFSLAVPKPAIVGRSTMYPTLFTATYNPSTDSYDLVLSNFVSTT